MSSGDRAKEVKQELDAVRRDLSGDIKEVVDGARTVTDYQYYLKRHPWACMAAAAAVGYMIVPRRLEVFSPDVETLQKLAKQNKLVVKSKPDVHEKGGGVVSILLTLLANAAVRTGVTYAGQHFGGLLGADAAKKSEQENRQTPHVSKRM